MGTLRTCSFGLFSCLLVVSGCHDHDSEEAAAFSEAFEEIASGKADDDGCSGVLTPDYNGFGKRVALTFDDGPNAATTPRVLDTLAAEGIRATFFINGSRVNDGNRDILQRIVDEGHILANHSQEHRNLAQQNLSTVRDQVSRTHEIIEDFATPTYFRFPYGSSTCNTASIVRDEFEQHITGWNVDSGDWCFAPDDGHCPASRFRHVPDGFRDDMVGWTMSQIRAKDGGIVLFHDIHAYTTNSLPEVIATIRAEGFTFTNLDDLETFPGLNGATLPWVGDECEGDDDCRLGASGEGVCDLPEGASVPFCTMECEGTCPDRGNATTFCVSLDGGASGNCVLKAKASNANCDDFDHLVMDTRDRHIGGSDAAPSTAQVCVPRP